MNEFTAILTSVIIPFCWGLYCAKIAFETGRFLMTFVVMFGGIMIYNALCMTILK